MTSSKVAGAATLLVAMAAGVLAAVATHDVAVETGAVRVDALGWLLPAIVEGAAVTAAVLAWRRADRGQRAWGERLALVALLGLAVWVNASHARGDDVLGVVLAAVPPVVLIATVELLLRARRERAAGPSTERDGQLAEQQARAQRVPEPRTPSKLTARSRSSLAVPGERETIVVQMLADNPGVTGAQVGDRVGCSPATGRRLLKAARERNAHAGSTARSSA